MSTCRSHQSIAACSLPNLKCRPRLLHTQSQCWCPCATREENRPQLFETVQGKISGVCIEGISLWPLEPHSATPPNFVGAPRARPPPRFFFRVWGALLNPLCHSEHFEHTQIGRLHLLLPFTTNVRGMGESGRKRGRGGILRPSSPRPKTFSGHALRTWSQTRDMVPTVLQMGVSKLKGYCPQSIDGARKRKPFKKLCIAQT